MRWKGRVVRAEEIRSAYKILVGSPEELHIVRCSGNLQVSHEINKYDINGLCCVPRSTNLLDLLCESFTETTHSWKHNGEKL